MGRPRIGVGGRKVRLSLSVTQAQRDRFGSLAACLGIDHPTLARAAMRIVLDELTPQEVMHFVIVNER